MMSHEGKNVADDWKAAIDELATRGLIDPTKVGVIGWSRTGFHVAALMADNPDLIAAATIADAVQYDYTQSVFAVGNSSAIADLEKVTGDPPAKYGFSKWFAENAFYKLIRSHAALRVEAIGLGSLLTMWETYATYAQAGKAADLVIFPGGVTCSIEAFRATRISAGQCRLVSVLAARLCRPGSNEVRSVQPLAGISEITIASRRCVDNCKRCCRHAAARANRSSPLCSQASVEAK